MSSGCSEEEDRHAPAVVKEADAKLLVDLLMLPPAADRHESFLSARGLLREGHLSWTKFTSLLGGKLAACQVDTRRVSDCLEHPEAWAKAMVCVTSRDEFLTGYVCEHCLVARHLFGDPLADPRPAA